MTTDGSGDDHLTKNQSREVAREKARALRDSHKKRDRRTRFLLQGGIIVVVLAAVVMVAIVITSGIRPPSAGPANMLSDGIKIGQGLKVVPTAALEPGDKPIASKNDSDDVIAITIYLDYQCPICGQFESTNAKQIKAFVSSGAATLEIHPIALLDNMSQGQKYSTRSANAAACVANYSPNSFYDFSGILFDNQPKENTDGLSDAKLISLTKKANVTSQDAIAKCITDQDFKTWVRDATARATTDRLPNSNVKKLASTPTIVINGLKYEGAADDAEAFAAAVQKAAGDSFTENSTASPSPTPSPSP